MATGVDYTGISGKMRPGLGGGGGCPWTYSVATCGAASIDFVGTAGDVWLVWGFGTGTISFSGSTGTHTITNGTGEAPRMVTFITSGHFFLSGSAAGFDNVVVALKMCGSHV